MFPDGLRVVSASGDGTLKVWKLLTGECVRTFEGHEEDHGTAVVAIGVTASVRHCGHPRKLTSLMYRMRYISATLLGTDSHSQNLSASLKRRDADTRPRFVVSRYIDTRRIMA